MEVPTFEQAMESQDIYCFELRRNVIGWQLSFSGGEILTLITKEQAEQIIERMEQKDIEDQSYEVD